MTVMTTASGRTKRLPDLLDLHRVAGLDPEGRIVVDDFDARNAEPHTIAGHTMQPFMFGLTLCCNASDKGAEDGIVCRGCYGDDEVGNYLFRAEDGSFPELDPVRDFGRGLCRGCEGVILRTPDGWRHARMDGPVPLDEDKATHVPAPLHEHDGEDRS